MPADHADARRCRPPGSRCAGKARRGNGELDVGVLQFVSASRHTRVVPEAIDYARPSFPPDRPVLEAALDLTERIYRDFTFDSTATDISTPVSHVLQERRGVCQDFAHLAITCLRAFGLPARYVSGYLLTYPPPGMEKLQGADASHAWMSVWAPEVGWVDFDPTNGIMPAEEHITVAYGRDYDDVSPISGVLLGGSDQTHGRRRRRRPAQRLRRNALPDPIADSGFAPHGVFTASCRLSRITSARSRPDDERTA